MSGGYWDYFFYSAPDHARRLASVLMDMEDYAERHGAKERAPVLLGRLTKMGALARELHGMLEKHHDLIHDIEWSASGDHGPEDFLEHEAKLPVLVPDSPTGVEPT